MLTPAFVSSILVLAVVVWWYARPRAGRLFLGVLPLVMVAGPVRAQDADTAATNTTSVDRRDSTSSLVNPSMRSANCSCISAAVVSKSLMVVLASACVLWEAHGGWLPMAFKDSVAE